MKFDEKKIEEGMKLIIQGVGEDLNNPNLRETPKRVADLYKDILNGNFIDVDQYVKFFPSKTENLVELKDVFFYSFCSHHWLPFIGKLNVSYKPKGKVIGLSKLVRIARTLAKKPQIQEDLTDAIADLLFDKLKPEWVRVEMECEHLCMSLRGVKTPGSKMTTSAERGGYIK